VAALAGMEIEDFCMLQCAYEVAAKCSSIIASLEDGSPCHARTMDWGALFLRGTCFYKYPICCEYVYVV